MGSGLEEFDEVAGRVGEQDLASSGSGDDVAVEGQPDGVESVDLGVEVVDDEMDAVPARGGGRTAG